MGTVHGEDLGDHRGKLDTTWSTDSRGFLKCESSDATQQVADTASDYNLDLALRRRGLAFEMADLMGWEAHEKLRNELMSSLSRLPPFQDTAKFPRFC